MKPFKARGIVLRENPAGESDKYVDLLLKGIGKISVSARGARKSTSKFLAGTQAFTYADFVIYDGGKFFTMSQIDIIDGFYGLRSDYDKLCYGNYFLELYCKVIIPGEECDDMLLLLIKTLSALRSGKVRPELSARVFELKFLKFNGYFPELKICAVCAGPLKEDVFFFSDGCICHACAEKYSDSFRASPGFIQALNYIECADYTNMFSFEAGQGTLERLKRAFEVIFNAHINVKIKSREFLVTYS